MNGGIEFLLQQRQIDVPELGITVASSLPGIELFMRAHGDSENPVNAFLLGPEYQSIEELGSVADCQTVEVLRAERAERLRIAAQESPASPSGIEE